MEDIYGNLDNYEEENVIDELKSENKELKYKLEEYASTLSNLQKDFDKLSSEYKKLELNYSSLLKTAKAEIERKTRIITNLNLEKDQLVLNALQKRGRIPPNQNKKNNKENSQKIEQYIVKGADSKKLNDDVKLRDSVDKIEPSTLNNERKNTQENTSSLHPTLKGITDVKEKETKTQPAEDPNRYRDKYKSDTKDVKENTTIAYNVVTEKVKDKVSKIRLRRKSMPLLNRGDFKFSSDEEQEDNTDNIREHRFRRKSPLREVIDRRYERDRNNRYDSKELPFHATEITRVEDKYSSHRGSVRDNHYKSNSRHNDNDWHRRVDPRDRYDTRSKTRLITDRYRSHARKEYFNDQSHRTDHGRHRVTVSSPPEKHNSFRRTRDLDRYRFQDDEAYFEETYKHKLHDATDEPSHKRLRTESPQRRPDDHIILQHDGHVAFHTAPVTELIPYSSLQSPDYNALDPHPAHKVKEIKGTATTKLDDPRLKSNKYVLNKHKDKVVLSTVVGRNLELKCINKDVWGVELQKMPTPLREKPQISEDFLRQIYMDNPLSNLSLESGEVDSEDVDDLTLTNVGNADKKLNTTKTNAGSINTLNVKHNQPELSKPNSQNESPITKTQNETSDNVQRKWRIPLLNKHNAKTLEDRTANTKTEDKRGNSIKQCHKKDSQEEKREIEKNKQLVVNPSKLNSNSRRSSRNKSKGHLPKLGHEEPYVEKPTVRDTVEGDLELSDETSDCTEFIDQTRYSKEKSGECDREPVIVRIPKEKLKEHGPDDASDQQGVFKQEIEKLCKNKYADISKLDIDAQPKELIKELKSNKDNRHNIKEDIKAKLCDLFGDSSSLITPDDLGFVEQPAVNPISNKYSPLFDNTQDAVDLNVEEMEKVQTQSSKVKVDEPGTNSNQHEVKQDKKHKTKSNKTNSERKRKLKNIPENTPVTESSIENIKEVLNNEPNVVKTVIISTGVQNSYQTENPISDKRQDILRNLPNLKALATSTPHKISLDKEIEQSLPVTDSISTASNNMSTNSNNVKGYTEDSNCSKTSQNDLDVPEFRIVVKRRRKARAPN